MGGSIYGCMTVYQMLFTVLTEATSHVVEPPVTSGKSQEEEKYDCPCRCGNNMGPVCLKSQFCAVFIYQP